MKITNKTWIIGTILIILIFFGSYILYKVVANYKGNLLLVTEKRIIEAARNCVREDVCENNKITLKELYDNNYLIEEYNPLTKEIYDGSSYILLEDNTYTFYPVY